MNAAALRPVLLFLLLFDIAPMGGWVLGFVSSRQLDLPLAVQLQAGAVQRNALILLAISWLAILISKAVATHLGRNRERLAQSFTVTVRISMWLLALLLVAEGLHLFQAIYVAASAGLSLGWLGLATPVFGAGLVAAAVVMIVESRRVLKSTPLPVTAIELVPETAPALWNQVRSVASRLGTEAPDHLLVGLAPQFFVTESDLVLAGTSVNVAGKSLYLSALPMGWMTEQELDAVIGHELSHFQREDIAYSRRFAPVLANLTAALAAVDVEDDTRSDASGFAGWFRFGRVPAYLALGMLLHLYLLSISRISREREFEADRAGAGVSAPEALVAAIYKAAICQSLWSSHLEKLRHRIRDNAIVSNLAMEVRGAARASMLDEQHSLRWKHAVLAHACTHPYDRHPVDADRAVALGIDPGTVFHRVVAEIADAPDHASLTAIEEQLTAIECELLRRRSWVAEYFASRSDG